MAYLCNVSPDLILSIDSVEDQTHFVLTTTANGDLRVRRSVLAIDARHATPEVLRTPTATLLRLYTNDGPVYARVYDDRVDLLADAPALDGATPLPIRASPSAMLAATPLSHTPSAGPVTQRLPPVAPAPPMPGFPVSLTAPQPPAMPDAPTVGMPITPPNMPVLAAAAAPSMPAPIVPAAPPSMSVSVAPVAPLMPAHSAPTAGVSVTPENPWDGSAAPSPPQYRSEQVSALLDSMTAKRRRPLWPFIVWGGITALMIGLNMLNAALSRTRNGSGAVTLATYLSIGWWFIYGMQVIIPLINRWRARLVRLAAGEHGSLRETIVFTLGIGLLIFVCACAPFSTLFSASSRVNGLALQNELLIYFIICVALAYTLLGNIVNWRETGDVASSHLLDNLSQHANEVYVSVIERMADRQLPRPYKAEFVEFEEQAIHSFEYQTVRQLNISYGRARVIFRVTARGTDLYVRWQSYIDFSMRRVAYVAALISQIMIAPLEAVSRNSLVEMISALFFTGRDSTGGREISADTIPLGNLLLSLNWNYIPSYTIDELQALEVAVTRSAEEVLNRLSVEHGREERINLTIDRSKSRYQRLF